MDERAVEWRCLLDEDVTFQIGDHMPANFASLLARSSGGHSTAFVGWQTQPEDLPPADGYSALVLVHPRGVTRRHLRSLGFSDALCLTALPSLADPRVFAPLANPRVAERALDFITLYRPIARAKRALTVQLARLGQLGRLGDQIVIARRRPSELERWVASCVQLHKVHLAISPGGISHKRKVTVQVVAPTGEVLGFAKVAMAPAAVAATRRETERLVELAPHVALQGVIPRLLAQTEYPGRFASLLSPGPRRLAAPRFGPAQRDFLLSLASPTTVMLPFQQSEMRRNLAELTRRLEPGLPARWRALAPATLLHLDEVFGARPLPLSMAHRDFQPGNMRQFETGGLYVFDWEAAQPQSTPLYDFFNFAFLHHLRQGVAPAGVARHVVQQAARWFVDADARFSAAYLTAFLLDHALRRLTNSDFTRDARSVFVLDAIAGLLEQQSAWVEAGARV